LKPKTHPGDINDDDIVIVQDLLMVINGWGPCPPTRNFCPAEATGDTVVNVQDMLMVVENWG
jgi:hypothetical protein